MFGLVELLQPLLNFMSLSGQMLPPATPYRVLLWLLTTGSLVLTTVLSSVELVISAAWRLGSALEIITILLTFLEMCLRVIYFSYKERQLANILRTFDHFPVSCSAFESSERLMQTRVTQASNRILRLFYGYVFFVLAGYLSLPFLPRGFDLSSLGLSSSDITASIVNPTRKRPLYIPVWVPGGAEQLDSLFYHLLVVWQAWSFVVLVCVFCAADCLLYTFIIFMVEGMRHLDRVVPGREVPSDPNTTGVTDPNLRPNVRNRNRVSSGSSPNIVDSNSRVQGPNKDITVTPSPKIEVLNSKAHVVLPALIRVVPARMAVQAHTMSRLVQPGVMGPARTLDWGLQADAEYKIWVRQHQFLLNLSSEVERFFSPIILWTFLANGAVMCVLAFVLVKLRDVVGILCVTGHLSCIVIKLYVMATFGQQLRDESTNVNTTNKVWPRLGTCRRTDARIINLRCNNPATLTGLGYFVLSVEVFGRVCSVALSYFIVLLQLH